MFGFMKSSGNKIPKQKSVDLSNPFDSDSESDNKGTLNPARRTASGPVLVIPDFNNTFDDDNRGRGTSSSSSSAGGRDRYKTDFCDSVGLQNQSVQELENYVVYKSEETTKSVKNCLMIAEDIRQDMLHQQGEQITRTHMMAGDMDKDLSKDIRQDATKTLDMLHQQGEQITRTHMMAADMDKDLSKGEKLLNGLGGMFSRPWKPKKTRAITGPMITSDNSSNKSEIHSKHREKLGLAPAPKGRSASQTSPPEPTNALQKVEVEKTKQDNALSDLSDILGDLKGMAVDMGSEIDR